MNQDQSVVQSWVTMVRSRYDDLPDRLTNDAEDNTLADLRNWRKLVGTLRHRYNKLPNEALPAWIQDTTGGTSVIPVLWAQRYMTEKEEAAWHRLFSCAAGQLASIAQKHWSVHAPNVDDPVELLDVLEYLPIAFLFVLGNYDPNTKTKNHAVDFSETADKNVRLSTWIHIEVPRHIKKYIQQEMYAVGNKANYMHRLRSQVTQLQDWALTTTGQRLSHEEVVDKIKTSTYYGQHTSKPSLSQKILEAEQDQSTVSTSAAVNPGTQDSPLIGDLLAQHSTGDIETNNGSYILARVSYDKNMQNAIDKLLHTDEQLNVDEQFAFNAE